MNNQQQPLAGRSALVTGASRGVGAAAARILASWGAYVVINYRDKARRAEAVAAEIEQAGGAATTACADLTSPAALRTMAAQLCDRLGHLDLLVLNASGGMERDADPAYAWRLNRDAQLDTLDVFLPLMPVGGRVVFVTSHQAHFLGLRPTVAAYEPVARSKRAGEDALRERIADLAVKGIDLVVVSGDMIEDTVTATLLERGNPGMIEARRQQVGELPSVGEFAGEVAAAAVADVPTGHTVYVGGADYLSS